MRYERFRAIGNRHRKLIELIRTGEYSSPFLAEKLDCSEQTIYRDIEFLKEQGYSICAVRIAKGWAYKLLSEPATIAAEAGAAYQ
jgi:DeoR/GlpR family transcriptional regulator of sugar metabolism